MELQEGRYILGWWFCFTRLVKYFYTWGKFYKHTTDNRMQKRGGGMEKETSIVGIYSRRSELYKYVHLNHGELDEWWGSMSCFPRSRYCIICIPGCLLHVYQLRPELSTQTRRVASRGLLGIVTVASKDIGIRNIQQLESSYTVLLYFTLYTTICRHTDLLIDTDNTVVISYYSLMFKPY